ncbi:MAG TPA: hypothetical protein VH186_35165 [Chloroflexia bacterium]|nr:hypothetical protein [Chloroflexia bacterium]
MFKSKGFLAGVILGITSLLLAGVVTVAALTTGSSSSQSGQALAVAAQAAPGTTAPAPAATPTPDNQQKDAIKAKEAASVPDDSIYTALLLKNLATRLNIPQNQLETAVANAVNDTADQMVKDGKLNQEVAAKIKATIAGEGVKGLLPLLGMGVNTDKGADFSNPKTMLLPAVEEVAKLFGTTGSKLFSKLQFGHSLIELAQAQNINVQTVRQTLLDSFKKQLDAAVVAGKLSQAQADKSFQQAPGFIDQFMSYKPDTAAILEKLVSGGAFEQVTAALGMTPEELKRMLGSGQTLADIARSKNVDIQKVKDTILNSARNTLAQTVKDGDLTQAEADAISQDLPAKVDSYINSNLGKPDSSKTTPSK